MKFRNLSWLNTPVKIHKFYVLLLALCFYNIAFGQNQPVTVSVKNQPLLKVFESIEKQTKLSIAYNQTKLNVNQKVTVDFKNESTATVLNTVLKNTGFSYRTEGGHIIIIPQPASVTNGKQENSAPKKKIQGIITDTKGEALIGANVQVIGSQLATITDVNGNFSMEVPENGQLSVCHDGAFRSHGGGDCRPDDLPSGHLRLLQAEDGGSASQQVDAQFAVLWRPRYRDVRHSPRTYRDVQGQGKRTS